MAAFQNAIQFFKACDGGKGWQVCRDYATQDAGFVCQSDALTEVTTAEAYSDWMKSLVEGPLPDARYELLGAAMDDERRTVMISGTFYASNSCDGGPVPATGKATVSHYVYLLKMNDEDLVQEVTKVWNSGWALGELGWA